MKSHKINRRQFVSNIASMGLAFSAFPGALKSMAGRPTNVSPNGRLNFACIGCGGMGWVDIQNVMNLGNIVALVDVDWNIATKAFEAFPDVPRYRDFREMLHDMGNTVDAVVVSTPDHTHATAAIEAMRHGKHVFCQKPLARSVYEIHQMQKAADKYQVITQLGNQGNASETTRLMAEWIHDGAIGEVYEIHAFCNANWGRIDHLPALNQRHPVPDHLDWELWQGPAEQRPYHPMFVPANWRGWSRYGGGAIGDWVCHVLDPSFFSLDLGAPQTILVEADDFNPKKHGETFSSQTRIEFEFPATGNRGPVKVVWFDGNARPPRPKELEEEREVPPTGAFIYGTEGVMMHGSHGADGLQIIPWEKMRAYNRPQPTLPRVQGGHYQDWIDGIMENRQAGGNFAYGGALTEIAVLANIALRFNGRKLEWDPVSMRFPNCSEADPLVSPAMHNGWNIEIT